MSPVRRVTTLILLGVAVLVISILVQISARDLTEHLLGVVGILSGLAIVVLSLPTSNGKDK
jgi:hypothetical protein